MEGFAFDPTVFTQQELKAILTGFRTLDSVSHSPKLELLAEKPVEEYAPESFTVMEDGRLYTEWGFTDSEDGRKIQRVNGK